MSKMYIPVIGKRQDGLLLSNYPKTVLCAQHEKDQLLYNTSLCTTSLSVPGGDCCIQLASFSPCVYSCVYNNSSV